LIRLGRLAGLGVFVGSVELELKLLREEIRKLSERIENQKQALKLRAAARALDMSDATLARRIRKGLLLTVDGGRRVSMAEISRFLSQPKATEQAPRNSLARASALAEAASIRTKLKAIR
jgi:hypothetical protein